MDYIPDEAKVIYHASIEDPSFLTRYFSSPTLIPSETGFSISQLAE